MSEKSWVFNRFLNDKYLCNLATLELFEELDIAGFDLKYGWDQYCNTDLPVPSFEEFLRLCRIRVTKSERDQLVIFTQDSKKFHNFVYETTDF